MVLRSDRRGGQTHDEDLDLARRCKRGDEDAQRSFVDRFGSLVYSVCGRSGIEGPDRDDVAQQILLDAFRLLRREMSVTEISRALHMPEGTVKTRLHRGRQALRKELMVP